MIKIFRKLRKVFENIVQLSLKKVYKATAIFVVAFLVFFTAVIPIIAASRVTTTPNISGTNVTVRWNQNTSFYWVGNYPAINVDGVVAYCIEPLVTGVPTNSASATNLDSLSQLRVMHGYSQVNSINTSQKRQVSLIANYGYGYPGHNTTAYRWATQVLIWEELGFTVTGGINISTEKANISALVNNHRSVPSWNKTTRTVKNGDIVDLSHSSISMFNITTIRGLTVTEHLGNTLKVRVTDATNAYLRLDKKQGITTGSSLIYTDGTTQRAGVFGLYDPVESILNFKPATGNITLEKQDVAKKTYANVVFELSQNKSTILGTYTTGSNGKVTVSNLEAGTYYVREKSVPEPLVLDPSWKTITVTAGNTTAFLAVNEIKPVATIGINKVRIDTKKASQGLDVEVWYDKVQNYNWNLSEYSNTPIKITLTNKTTGKEVLSKTHTIQNFPTSEVYKVPSNLLSVNNKSNYEVSLSVASNVSHQIEIDKSPINTDGYTASEALIEQKAQHGQDVHVEQIIRTEREFGKSMQTWKESFTIDVPVMKSLRAGRGYAYDTLASYSNELNQSHSFELVLNSSNELVDGNWYQRGSTHAKIPLLLKENSTYVTPRVAAKRVVSGDAISGDHYDSLSSSEKLKYREGGHQILTPMWSTDVGIYDLYLETSSIGVNSFRVKLNDEIEIYAYMFGWFDENGTSPTIKEDETIISPIMAVDRDGNGMIDMWDESGVPDNWGVELADGTKVLTLVEKQFFDILGPATVSYDLNGGSGSFPGLEVTEGDLYQVNASTPTKNNFIFGGWTNSVDGKTYQPGESFIVEHDTKLTAQWKQNVYTVTFNLNGGGGSIASQTVEYGSKVIKPSNPSRTGYSFTGWSPDINQPITTNTTFVAQWSINTYSITYNANGGSGAPSAHTKTHDQANQKISSTVPTRTGYTFVGWNTVADGSGTSYASGANWTVNQNLTLYARWSLNTYSITYNANGGSGAPSSQTKGYGTNISLSTAKPTRTGYTFTGWNTSANGSGTSYASGATYTGNANVTLYAQWSADTYSITYNANGGSGAPGVQTKTHGTKVALSATKPTRAGYTFAGWNTLANGSGTSYASGATYTGNANVTLYAKWTAMAVTTHTKTVSKAFSNNSAYTLTLKYTSHYQGTILLKVEYEYYVRKSSGSGFFSNVSANNSYSQTVAGTKTSGSATYDFRVPPQFSNTTFNNTNKRTGTRTINSTSFTNSITVTVSLANLGSATVSGNFNK